MRQAQLVAEALEDRCGHVRTEFVGIVTGGDRAAGALAPLGGKGLFTAELEEALRRGDIHLAVHSAKDLPVSMSGRFTIAAIPGRDDPRDALLSRGGGGIEDLPRGASVGTASPRRRAQLLCCRGDLNVVPVRGNVETRVRRVLEPGAGALDAVVLAMAGLKRCGLTDTHGRNISPLDAETFVPAAGQGILVAQYLTGAAEIAELLEPLEDAEARSALLAERLVLRELGAGCRSCIGVHVAPKGPKGRWKALAMAARADGAGMIRLEAEAASAEAAGADLLHDLRRKGAGELLSN